VVVAQPKQDHKNQSFTSSHWAQRTKHSNVFINGDEKSKVFFICNKNKNSADNDNE